MTRSLVGVSGADPWFPLGSDGLGRDVLSRLTSARGSRSASRSAPRLLALVLGVGVGATAGYRGGWIDEALMRAADLVLVLPGIYVILALRGAMPLVLSTAQVFAALVGVLGLVGWPGVAGEYAESSSPNGGRSTQKLRGRLAPDPFAS